MYFINEGRKFQGAFKTIFQSLKCSCGRFCSLGSPPSRLSSLTLFSLLSKQIFRLPQTSSSQEEESLPKFQAQNHDKSKPIGVISSLMASSNSKEKSEFRIVFADLIRKTALACMSLYSLVLSLSCYLKI
jgi:hypothetical protein